MGCFNSKPVEQQQLSQMKTSDAKFSSIYSLAEELGTGAFSVVRLATNKETGKIFAAKIIKKASLGKADELALRQENIKFVFFLIYLYFFILLYRYILL